MRCPVLWVSIPHSPIKLWRFELVVLEMTVYLFLSIPVALLLEDRYGSQRSSWIPSTDAFPFLLENVSNPSEPKHKKGMNPRSIWCEHKLIRSNTRWKSSLVLPINKKCLYQTHILLVTNCSITLLKHIIEKTNPYIQMYNLVPHKSTTHSRILYNAYWDFSVKSFNKFNYQYHDVSSRKSELGL